MLRGRKDNVSLRPPGIQRDPANSYNPSGLVAKCLKVVCSDLDYDAPVFTDDVASYYPVFKGPATL